MSAEIEPDWKQTGLILLAMICIFVLIASGRYLLQVRKAQADELLYHHLDREFPRLGSLVYVPLDDCLHLAWFDLDTGYFYDKRGWLDADKWLYVTDRWPDKIETCTSEDLKNDPRLQ